jgi:hypothetical protein
MTTTPHARNLPCRDPDCFLCYVEAEPPPSEHVVEKEWIWGEPLQSRWQQRIRFVVRALQPSPKALRETPLVEIAEEEISGGSLQEDGSGEPVVHGRDILFLTLEDAQKMRTALDEAIAFLAPTTDGPAGSPGHDPKAPPV